MTAAEFADWMTYQAVEANPMLYAEERKVHKLQTPSEMRDVAKMLTGWFRG